MSRDIEDLLRRSMRHHTEDLRPDPETWNVVRRRIRRGQRLQWALAGATAMAVVAVTAVVLPSTLTGGNDVQLQPADRAPEAERVVTPTSPPLGGFVLAVSRQPGSGGEGTISLAAPDGRPVQPLVEAGAAVQDLAVRPGATTDDFTVVWRAGSACDATLGYAIVEGREVAASGPLASTCPGAPVFSPDGRHLAFPDAPADDPSAFVVQVLGWDDDGPAGAGAGTASLGFDSSGVERLSGVDWRWEEDAAASRGVLSLSGAVGGEARGFSLEIERQADGALALDPDAALAPEPWLVRATPYPLETRISYEVVAVEAGADLVRRPPASGDAVALPDGWDADGEQRPWLAAAGDVAVVGGADRAWVVTWDEGWGEPEPLPGNVRHAVPLLGEEVSAPETAEATDEDPLPAPEATTAPAPSDPPAEESPARPGQEGLPPAVEQTRAALHAAAAAGDWDALGALVPSAGFSYTFDDDQDPALAVAHLRSLADGGEPVLDILAGLLEQSSGSVALDDGRTVFSWPRAFVDGIESLSSAELLSLQGLAGEDEVDASFERGYKWWRVGIDSDGVWRYFLAGD